MNEFRFLAPDGRYGTVSAENFSSVYSAGGVPVEAIPEVDVMSPDGMLSTIRHEKASELIKTQGYKLSMSPRPLRFASPDGRTGTVKVGLESAALGQGGTLLLKELDITKPLKTDLPKAGVQDPASPFRNWFGPLPKQPESLKGWEDYTSLLERNAKGKAGFLEGVTPTQSNIPFYGVGKDAVDIGKLVMTANRIRDGKPVADQDVLDMNIYLANMERQSTATKLGKTGKVFVDMLTFMAEMGSSVALMSALGAGAGTGAAALSGKASVKAGQSALQKLAMSYSKELAERALTKKYGSAAANWMRKGALKTASKLVAAAPEVAVMTTAPTIGQVGSSVLQTTAAGQEAGTRKGNQDRLFAALKGEDMDATVALWRGIGDTVIENWSESLGGLLTGGFSKVTGLGAIGKKFGNSIDEWARAAGVAAGDVNRIKATSVVGTWFAKQMARGVPVRSLTAHLKNAGYHGVVGEMLEERAGDFVRGLTGLEGEKDDDALARAVGQMIPSWEQAQVELMAFSLPMAIIGGAHGLANVGRWDEIWRAQEGIAEASHLANNQKIWEGGKLGAANIDSLQPAYKTMMKMARIYDQEQDGFAGLMEKLTKRVLNMKYDRAEGRMVSNPDILFASTMSMPVAEVGNRERARVIEDWKKQHPTEKTVPDDVLDEADASGAEFAAHVAAANGRYALVYRDSEQGARERDAFLEAWKSKPENKGKAVPKEVQEEADAIFAKNYKPGTGGTTTMDRARKLGWSEKDLSAFAAVGLIGIDKERGLIFMRDPESLGSRENDLAADALLLASDDPKAREIVSKKALNLPMLGSTYEEQVKSVASAIGRLKEATPERLTQARVGQNITPGRVLNLSDKNAWEADMQKMERDDPNFHRMGLGEWMDWKGRRTNNLWLNPDLSSADPGTLENMLYRYASNKMTDLAERSRARFLLGGAMQATLDSDIAPLVNILAASRDGTFFLPSDVFTEPSTDPNAPEERYRVQSVRYDQATQKDLYSVVKLDLFGAPTATVLKDMTVEQLKGRFALPEAPEIRLTEFDFVDGTFEEMRQHLFDANYITVDHLRKEGETPNEALKRYTEEDMRKALFPHVAPYTTADGKRLWRYKNGAMSHDFGILVNLLSIAESEGAGMAEDFLEVLLRRLSIGADGQKSVANLFSAMPLSAAGFRAAVASASAVLQAKIKSDGATREQRSKAAADLAELQALPSLESDDVVKVIEFFSKFLIRFENGYINSPAAAKMPLARGFAVLSENATNFNSVVRDAKIELGRVAPQSYIRALDYKKREAPAEETPPAAGPLATPPEPKEPPKPGDGAAPAKAEDPVLSPAPAPAKKAEAPPAEAPAVVEAVPAPVAEQPAAADAPAAAGVEAAPQAAEQQVVAAPFAPADATPQNSLAVLRPDGSIVVDEAAARADFGAGFPYLRGESPLTGSAQKKEVFARVDLEKFKAALGSAERYIEFIRLHEEGHRAQRESGELKTYPKDWMSPEAILIERKANKYAMDALGIKISDVRKEVAADAPPQEVDFANIPPKQELDLGVVETPEPSAEELEAVRLLDVEQQANVFVPPEVSDEFVIPVEARIPVPEVEIPLEAMQAPEEELSQEQLDAKRMLDEGNYADQDKGARVKKNAPRASVSKEGRRRAAARFKEGMSIAAETKDRAIAIFRALPAEDRAALLRRVYFIADYSDLVPEATHRDLQRELARIPGFTQDEIDSLYVAVLDEDPSIAPFLRLTTREQEAVDAEEAGRAAKELALNGEPSDELAALFGESEAADALEFARSGSDNAMAGKANDAKVAKLLHSELRSLGMLSRRYGGASLIPLAIEGFRSKYGSRGTPAFLRNDEAFEAWAAEQKADEFSTKRLSAAGLRNLVEIELASMSRMKAIEVFSALTGTVPVEAVLFELSDRAESGVRPYSASESSPGALLRTRRNDLFANPTEFISEFLVRMEPYAIRDAAGNVTGWNDPAIYPDDVLKSEVSESLARLFAFLMLPRAAREDLGLSSADVQKALWRWATNTKAEEARRDRLESLGQPAPAVFRSTVKMWLKTAVEAARITRTNPDGVARKLDYLMYQLTDVTDPRRQALVQHMRLPKMRRLTIRVGSQTVNPLLRGTLGDFYDKMEAAGMKDKIMLFGGFKAENDRLVKVSESLWNEFMLGWKEYVRNQHSVFVRGKRTANEAHIPVHIETGDKTDRIYMYRATFKEMFGDAKIDEDFDKFYATMMSKDGPWSHMFRSVAAQTYGVPAPGAEAKWFKRTSQLVTPRDRLQEVDGGLVFERNPETNEPELLVAVPRNVGENYGGDGAMYVLRSKEAQFRRSAGLPDGTGPIVAKGQFIAGPALMGPGNTVLIKTASAATSAVRAKFIFVEGNPDLSVLSAAAMLDAEDGLSKEGVTFVASPSARKLDIVKPEKTVTSGGVEYDIYRAPAHAFGFAATMDTSVAGSRNPNIANQSILVEASALAAADPVAAEFAASQLADMYSGNRERLLKLLSAEGEWTPGFEKSLADGLEEDQPAMADLLREQGLARAMEIPEVFHAVARKVATRTLERGLIPVSSQGVYAALTSVESSDGTPSNSVSRYELKTHGILGEGWETNAGEDNSWLTPTMFAEDGTIRPAMVGIPITDSMRRSNSFYGEEGDALRREIADELAPQMPWTTSDKIYEVLPAFDAYRANSREFRFDEAGTPFRSAEDVVRMASFLASRYDLGVDLLQSDEMDDALYEPGRVLSDFTGVNIRGGAILPRTENGVLVGVVISGTPGLTDYRVPYSSPASGTPFILAFDTGGPVAVAHPDVVKGKGADFDFDAGHVRLIDPRSSDFRLVRRAWRMREALNAAGWNAKDFGVNPDALMSALDPLRASLSAAAAPAYASPQAIAQNIESVRAAGAIGLLASFNFSAQFASPFAVPPSPMFSISKDRVIEDKRMWPGKAAHNGHPLPVIRAAGKMNHELYRVAVADALLNVIVDYIKMQEKAAPLGMVPESLAMMAWGVYFLEVPETVPAPVEIVVNKKTDERRMQTEHEARYAHVARHTVGAMANYFRSSPVAMEWMRLAKSTASLLSPLQPREIAGLVREKFDAAGQLTPEVELEINALVGVEAHARGMFELSAVLRANQKVAMNSVADILELEGKAARLLYGQLSDAQLDLYGLSDTQASSPLGAPVAGSGVVALQVAVENALAALQRLRGAGFPDPLSGIAQAIVDTANPFSALPAKKLDAWKKALVGLVAKRHNARNGIIVPAASSISIAKRAPLEHAVEGMFLVDALTAMRGKSVPFAELYNSVKERLDNLAVNDPTLSTNPLVANLFLSTYSRAKGEGRQIEYKMEVVDAPQDMSERTEAWDDLPMDLQIDLAELNVRMHGAMGGVQGSLSDWFSPAFLYARQPHVDDAKRWYSKNLSPALLSTPEWKENLLFVLGPTLGGKASNFGGRGLQNFKVLRDTAAKPAAPAAEAPAPVVSEFAGVSDAELADMHTKKRSLAIEAEINRRKKAGQGISQWKLLAKAKAKAAPAAEAAVAPAVPEAPAKEGMSIATEIVAYRTELLDKRDMPIEHANKARRDFLYGKTRERNAEEADTFRKALVRQLTDQESEVFEKGLAAFDDLLAWASGPKIMRRFGLAETVQRLTLLREDIVRGGPVAPEQAPIEARILEREGMSIGGQDLEAALDPLARSMQRAKELKKLHETRTKMPDSWTSPDGSLRYDKVAGKWVATKLKDGPSAEATIREDEQTADLRGFEVEAEWEEALKVLSQADNDFAFIAESVEQWKREQGIVYDPKEAHAVGEAFYHDVGAFNHEAPGLLGKIASVLLAQQRKLRRGERDWWKDTENQLVVSGYTARAPNGPEISKWRVSILKPIGGLEASHEDFATEKEARTLANRLASEQRPHKVFKLVLKPGAVRPGRGMRFVVNPSSRDIVWAAVGDVYSGTVSRKNVGPLYTKVTQDEQGKWGVEVERMGADEEDYDHQWVPAASREEAVAKELKIKEDLRESRRIDPKAPSADKLGLLADSVATAIQGRRPQNYNEIGVRLRLGNFYIEGEAPSELRRLNELLKRAYIAVHGSLDPMAEKRTDRYGMSIDSNERFPGLPNPGQNKNTFSTRLKDGKPDPDFDLKNPESKINREAVVIPAHMQDNPAELRTMQVDAEIARMSREQAKRERLLSNPAELDTYAAEQGISSAEMRKTLGDNLAANAPRLASFSAYANSPEFSAKKTAEGVRQTGISFRDMSSEPGLSIASEEAVSSLQDTLSLGNVLLYRAPHPAFPDAGAVIHKDEGILYLRDKASLPQMLASYAVSTVGADAPMLSTPVAPVTAQALNETVRLNYADSQLSSLLRDEITARLTGAPSLFVVPASGDMRSLWLAELAADMADLLQSNPMELLSQMRLNRKGNALVLAPLPKPRELSPGPRQLSPNDSLPWDKALSASVVPESLRTDLAEAPGPLGALLDVRAAADKGEIDDRLERVLIRSAYESLPVVTLPGVTGEADARQLEMGLSMASGYIGEYNSRRMTLKAMGIPAMHLALFDAMNELDRARTNGGLWLETEASIMEFGSPFLHLLKTNKKGYRYRDRLSRTALTLRQRQILMRYRAAVTAMAEHANQFDLSDPATLARLKDEAKVVHGRYHKLYAETDAQAAQSAVLPEMETVSEIERDFLKEVAPLMLDPKKGGRTKEEIDLVSIVGRVKAQYDADVDAINQATADFTGGTNFLGYRANYAPHFYGWSPATDPAGEAADRDIAKQLKHADIEQTLLRKPGGAMDESAQEKHKKRIDPWTEVQQDLIAKLNHKLYARLASADEAPNIVQANSMILRELRRILFDSAARHYAEGGDNPGEWAPKGMEINYLATARHIDKVMRNTRFVEFAPAELARTYATYEEAYLETDGTLRPRTMDYISLRKEYLERTYAAAAHKATLNAFLGFTDINGKPLIMAKPAEKIDLDRGVIKRQTWETYAANMARYYKYDYRPQGDLVAQLREMYEKHAGDERTHIIETPKVSSIEQWSAIGRNPARLIKRMVGLSPTDTSALARAYMGAVAWTKSLSFGWSAFFHTALAESVIYQSGPWKRNLFKAYLAKLFTSGKNKEFDKFWERVEAFREHRRYYNPAVAADLDVLLSSGMTTGRTAALENYVGRFQQDVANIAARMEERYGKDMADRLMLVVFGDKNATGWKKWWPGLTGAKMSNWMFEWFSAVKEAQMDLYLKDMAAEHGLDNGHGVPWKQARFMAQTFNDGLGGQNWNKYLWATPNVMFWLNAIMLAPNWCCPQDTRAMTKTGFKFCHELEIGDEILVFDPETKTTRWSPLKDKFVRNDYDGDMVYVKNYSRAVAMTPEHTCYVTTRSLPAQIMKAKDLYPACQIPRAAPHSELPTESTVADRLVVLAGWLVTDGYVKRTVLDMKRAGGTKEFRYGKIVQSKPAMVAALKALGLQFHTEPLADSNFKANFQKHVFSIPPAEYRELESLGLMDGELSWEFISRLTKPQLELLHATMLLGDGTGQNRFCGKEREVFHMALIQTLLGKPTVFWEQKQEGGHCWLTRTASASYIGCENGALSTKHYSGGIWCPSVETGFWVAEREGLMFITGNTLSSWNASGLGPLTQSILRNYSAPGQQRKIWTEFMPAMVMWNMIAIPYALQAAIYGVGQLFGGDDDDTPLPILNEPGRKQHVDITPVMRLMPWYKGDPTGKRRMYIQFAKQVHETGVSNPFGERGWINEPIDQFMRKLSQPVKIVYEQITGLSPGSDWTLEFKDKGFLGWFNSGEPGLKGAMTSRLGYIAQKFTPMSASQFMQNPEVFPWNHLAPTSKGASQKAIIESMATILATYASGADWHRIRQVPRARAVLDGLMPEYMKAATANGYNADKLLNTAKGIVLGGLYDDMWRALDKNDEALMRKSAASIWRVGGTLKGLNSSLSNKESTYGKEVTPEMRQNAADAMNWAMYGSE